MATHHPTSTAKAAAAAKPAASLFSVRLWKEELATGSEYRGSVREVTSDSFRGFRDWSDLVAFMVARLENDGTRSHAGRKEAGDVSD